MALGMNDYLAGKVVGVSLQNVSYTPPTTIYCALCTTTPVHSDTGTQIQSGSGGTGVEVTGGNYSRQSLSASTGNFSNTTGSGSNQAAFTWSSVTWSGTVTGFALLDASSNGNVLYQGAFSASKSVSSGDTVTIPISDLTYNVNAAS